MRTQVAIVGAGPAGVLLARLLAREGVDAVVIERRSRAHVEGRIRAGVLEQGTVETLELVGAGQRLSREGLVHEGIEISLRGERRRINFRALTGKAVVVYGQTEVQKDLNDAFLRDGGRIVYEARDVALADIAAATPTVAYADRTGRHEVRSDFIAGCDGFHGVTRQAIPKDRMAVFERGYPFAWLGMLAATRPISDELIYARHASGFALFSMRSATLTRLYLQCRPEEEVRDWPDARIWAELALRLGDDAGRLDTGPSLEKAVLPMRSFVLEPMRHGRLFLAGDAAHIVPPTGAKGLNLALADARLLAEAMVHYYRSGSMALLDAYSATCLRRVWRAQRFSWWMTSMLHTLPDDDYGNRVAEAELDYVTSSRAASTVLAENYTGLSLA